MVEALSKAFEEQYQKKRNVPSRPISQIEWFQSPATHKKDINELLMKIPKEQFAKPAHAKREDLIFRKTKIICTLGKYTSNLEAICKLIEEGTNIFRINMSTIQNKEHKVLIEMIKRAQKLTKTKVGILMDLQGPVIRTGDIKDKNSIKLKTGQEFRICTKKKIQGDESFICVDFSDLANKLKIGDHIIIDFGAVCMRVNGFEDEGDFLASKQLEGHDIKPSIRQIKPTKTSLSFQGQKIRNPENVFKRFQNPDYSTSQTDNTPSQSESEQREFREFEPRAVHQPSIHMADVIKEDFSSIERDKSLTKQQEPIQMINQDNQQKKKFKVRFDEAYQKSHEEKSQMEKEIFENALKQKRYQNPSTFKSYEEVKEQNPQVPVKQNTLDRRNGNFPQLTVIQESNKEGSTHDKINQSSKESGVKQEPQTKESDSLISSKRGSIFKTVGSAHCIPSLGLDDQQQRARNIPMIPNRRRKKVIKERKVIVCRNEFDCEIKPLKPLYFPEFDHKQEFDLSVVTTKDIRDIHSSIKLGVDFISVSYVETKEDILEVKELLSIQGRHIKVMAKIMNSKALQNFEEILDVSDGIIIARGYLGLDLKLEDVAYVQKYLIKKCNIAGKPVILSTQIMESMVYRKRPTRAEVSDISNAVYDGIDCCILSSETQTGPFYVEACEAMSKICYEAEKHIDYENNYLELQTMIMQQSLSLSIGEAISNCAVKAAYEMSAKLIIVFTNSGQSAITVSKYKPQCPILAVSASDKSAKQCMVSKGIYYLLVGSLIGADSLLDKVKKEAMTKGLIKKGDFVVVTTGVNEGLEGSTNLLKILQV